MGKFGGEEEEKDGLHQDSKRMYMFLHSCKPLPGQTDSLMVTVGLRCSAAVVAQQENTSETNSTSSSFEWECLTLQYSAVSRLRSFYVYAEFNICNDLHRNNFNSLIHASLSKLDNAFSAEYWT